MDAGQARCCSGMAAPSRLLLRAFFTRRGAAGTLPQRQQNPERSTSVDPGAHAAVRGQQFSARFVSWSWMCFGLAVCPVARSRSHRASAVLAAKLDVCSTLSDKAAFAPILAAALALATCPRLLLQVQACGRGYRCAGGWALSAVKPVKVLEQIKTAR